MHTPEGYDIHEVDRMLKATYYDTSNLCLICGNMPEYQIIPKDDKLYTIEIQDKGYICKHCTEQKYIDPALYGLRPLRRG